MENTVFGGQAQSPAYDFRVYDQVWHRVSPGTDPFAEDPAMVPGEDSLQATRVLNLDELQFGRNYKP